MLEPGLYELPRGSRAGDAIEAAGGMTKKAAQGSVNLALQLEDGQQVVVPSKTEGVPSSLGDAQASPSAGGPDDSSNANGFVNINTATAEQLQQLSGIGEALSQRIIDYRESNGAFASVDDLTKVSGIGDARLESIRDGICV